MFDGGAANTPPLEEPKMKASKLPWKSLRISSGGLWVADMTDPCKAITYPYSSEDTPFTQIPRKAALEMTGILDNVDDSNRFCVALDYSFKDQRSSLHREKSRKIFSDFQYWNMGD